MICVRLEEEMAIRLDGPMGQLIDAIADRFAERLMSAMNGTRSNGRRSSALKGRKRDMHCRYPGGKNRSKGPRFPDRCEQRLKLPTAKATAGIQTPAEAV